MRRRACLLALVIAGGAMAWAGASPGQPQARAAGQDTPTPQPVPTVAIVSNNPASVPTVTVPHPKPTPRPKPPAKVVKSKPKTPAEMPGTWIWAYLTSYCPGSAGWLSSSGSPVYYGMLANDFYQFGTHVYIPVIGLVGVVEDHVGDYSWNHFDVWSAVCYSTPTGYFKVKVLK